jgi:hypothetical protein
MQKIYANSPQDAINEVIDLLQAERDVYHRVYMAASKRHVKKLAASRVELLSHLEKVLKSWEIQLVSD